MDRKKVEVDLTEVVLETDRLILRGWKHTDLMDFFQYARVPGVGEMAGWNHHKSLADTQEILTLFMMHQNIFALELKETHRVIGSLGYEDKRLPHVLQDYKGLELGYVLSKDHWGKGLMVEAAMAAIDYGFEHWDLDYFTCGHFDENHQSQRVIEKLGFQFFMPRVILTSMEEERQGLLHILWHEKYKGISPVPKALLDAYYDEGES